MKRSRIKPISKKKSKELQQEAKIRQQLMERCNGLCEGCHGLPDFRGLHPHEKLFRSHGGKMSLDNSIMICGKCHSEKHNIREV